MRNVIECHTLQEFLTLCYGFTKKVMTFTANTRGLTITLTGGY